MKLGKHVSIAGGLNKAITRAVDIGCNAMQIFVKNPRGWQGKELTEAACQQFREAREEVDLAPVVVHATYLINIASPREDLWQKSVQGLKDDYRRSVRIGADHLVFHPGSHTGSGIEAGIEKIAAGIDKVLDDIEGDTKLLLENVDGSGTKIGAKFSELKRIISLTSNQDRLGICVDTCHAYAFGYDVANKEGLDSLTDKIDSEVGLENLEVLHINDSVYELNSQKDEHAHIGEGEIGREGFKNIVNYPRFKHIPLILETPWFDDRDDDPDVDSIKAIRNYKNNQNN